MLSGVVQFEGPPRFLALVVWCDLPPAEIFVFLIKVDFSLPLVAFRMVFSPLPLCHPFRSAHVLRRLQLLRPD